jgi:hypothetical protein
MNNTGAWQHESTCHLTWISHWLNACGLRMRRERRSAAHLQKFTQWEPVRLRRIPSAKMFHLRYSMPDAAPELFWLRSNCNFAMLKSLNFQFKSSIK